MVHVTAALTPSFEDSDASHETGLSNAGYERLTTQLSYLNVEGDFTRGEGEVHFEGTFEGMPEDGDGDDSTGLTAAAFDRLHDGLSNLGFSDIDISRD